MQMLIQLDLCTISGKLQIRIAGDLSQLEDQVLIQNSNFSFSLYTPSFKGLVLRAMQQFSG